MTTPSSGPDFATIRPARRGALALIILLWFLTATLYSVPYFVNAGKIGLDDLLSHFASATVGALCSAALFPVVRYGGGLSPKAGVAFVFVGAITASIVMSMVDIVVFDAVADALAMPRSEASLWLRGTSNFAVFTSKFLLIAGIIWVIETNAARRAGEAELAHARTSAAEAAAAAHAARLSALRYQLNPHFLFNTMNAISSLVITRRNAQAEEMLGRLSEFLRVTLTADPEARQTLDGELDTVQAYLDIERIRFGDRLAVDVDCPCELRDATLPAFLLQPLVENAIKHGVAESDDVVTIRIEATTDADSLVVIVEDDGGSRDSDRSHEGCGSPGTGVGLRNVEARLDALYGLRGHLEIVRRENGFLAIVRLPLDLGQVAAA